MHCHVGPDWPLVIFVICSIISVNVTVLYFTSVIGWPVVLIGTVGALALLFCYFGVAFTDPDIIYKSSYVRMEDSVSNSCHVDDHDLETSRDLKIGSSSCQSCNTTLNSGRNVEQIECGQCHINRPITATHCPYCNVCINALDHHCPWCGKCIGRNNYKCFLSFLYLLSYQCTFLIGTLVYFLLAVNNNENLPRGPKFE